MEQRIYDELTIRYNVATGQKRIFDDVTHTVGNTPLVRLDDRFAVEGAELLTKLEYFNPTTSVKDRLSVGAIKFAEKTGKLQPGGTIVAASSGNSASDSLPREPPAAIASCTTLRESLQEY